MTYELVRMKNTDSYFVLRKGRAAEFNALGSQYDYETVAESDDKAELERFRDLTEES